MPTERARPVPEVTWRSVVSSPENVVVWTKIDDGRGVRNVQKLKRQGRLWWVPDGGMYVYYAPTHWAPDDEVASPLSPDQRTKD